MTVRLYNTLTQNVDEFTPIKAGFVSLYTCGPTVYSYPQIGNWAAYIYWDTLIRVLKANNFEVCRVMNITDVGHLVSDADEGQDKLEKGAKREGKTAWEVAQFYSDDFIAGMRALNLIAPDHIPRATEFISQQLDLVRTLKQKGYTYQISDGIYFDTSKFPSYADFGHLDLEALKAGARVEYNPEKRNVSDFALWKFSPAGETRDMEWDTPQDLLEGATDAKGFPGWHLECSGMAMTLLGKTIDIHTGGIDHIPVHHTNEIAQSEAATGQIFAHYWLHNNHLMADGTKISKSLGNGYTLGDIVQRGYDPLDLRLFVLQSHYQTESNFTFDNLAAAKNRRWHWRNVAALRHQTHDTLQPDYQAETDSKTIGLYAASQALVETLDNNLDTPEALKLVDEAFDLVVGHSLEDLHEDAFNAFLQTVDDLLGLKLLATTPDINDDQKRLIIERQRARDQKDFNRSDSLRDELLATGIIVRDTVSGPVWEYAEDLANERD